MNLIESITAVNALPLSEAQKAAIIAQLILAAPAPAPAAPVDVASQQATNLSALRATVVSAVAGEGGKAAAQTATAQAKAETYIPFAPSADEGANPPLWAYRNFLAAGYSSPSAPNGPVERWGSQIAQQGGLGSDWVAAFKAVVAGYKAGTANIQDAPAWSAHAINAGNYSPDSYTPEQKMAMQFAVVAGGDAANRANVWLDKALQGDGVNQNLKFVALGQMFGASGDARLYNPIAGAAMVELIAGKSADYVLGNLTAQKTGTAGYAESLAALTPEWFALAQATIAKFK